MKITDYILRYKEHTEGEDSLYRSVAWTSNYDCPVSDLIPGEDVPFKPDKSLSEPSIKCIEVTDNEVVIAFEGYTGDGNQGLKKFTIHLSPDGAPWSSYFGGGRYDTDRSLMLIKPEDK